MSNNLKNLKTNFTLVITALIVGIITSVVAQIFTLTAKSIFSLIQSNQSYNLLTISFYNFDVNVLPFFACIIAAIFIGILIKYQKIDRWHGPADTIYAAHQEAGALDVKEALRQQLQLFQLVVVHQLEHGP